jgi:hypothetical protein
VNSRRRNREQQRGHGLGNKVGPGLKVERFREERVHTREATLAALRIPLIAKETTITIRWATGPPYMRHVRKIETTPTGEGACAI